MRKLKIFLLTLTVVIAIGGAYAGSSWYGNQSWRSAIAKADKKADPTRDLTPAEQKACDCTQFQQYYECQVSPRTWCEVEGPREEGWYTCMYTVGVCTFYKPFPDTHPNYYAPCQNGFYWETWE